METGFSRRNGRLYAENVPLSEIAARFGTPCYVYSQRVLLDNLSRIKANFARSKPTVFFAVKANSNIAVLQLLHHAGCGFDIVSAGELARVLAAGGSAKQTVFSGVGKSLHDMRTALAAGVGCFNVESLAELARLEALAKEQKTIAPIAFRINPNIYAGTHDYLTTGGDDNKFGILPGDLLPQYQRVATAPHLDFIGLSCHLGSQITNGEAYISAAEHMKGFIDEAQAAGANIQHINMGGGFAVNYETGETPAVALEQYDEKLAALFPDTEIWLEPGRAIAATAGVLLTTVEYVKKTGKTYWIVDAGMNALLRPALYGARHRVEDVDGNGDPLTGETGDVAGPICESGDVLANDCELQAKAGDLLAVRDVGAYGAAMMSTYNSHPRPCEVLVSGYQTALIRERDREEDLLHGELLANFIMTSPREKVCVIGLGYVGLPLAVALAAKHEVVGYDNDAARLAELARYEDSTGELRPEDLRTAQLRLSHNIADVDCGIYIITVPTPVREDNRPDLSPLQNACRTVGKVLRRGNLVIIESTVYPGVTEEICAPILATAAGLRFNEDFTCGYSPERINPADREHPITAIKKITAGSTPAAAKRVDNLYRSIITAGTHLAPSIRVAEAAKVVENTQRDVNIALMNELAMVCHSLGIEASEVFAAAASKWNFLPFTPGLVGGHCIGVDPYYLCHKAQLSGYQPNLILAARQINDSMGRYVAEHAWRLMARHGLRIKGAKVLILGFSFKENCPDPRNSRVDDLYRALLDAGCHVRVCDPVANAQKTQSEYGFTPTVDITAELERHPDLVIFAVPHRCFADISADLLKTALVMDIKGAAPRADWRL